MWSNLCTQTHTLRECITTAASAPDRPSFFFQFGMIKKVVADVANSTALACASANLFFSPFISFFPFFPPFQTTLLIRPVAQSRVSKEGNMSVSAHDELLRQSLQQSLCPNEKEFSSFIPSFIYFIFHFLSRHLGRHTLKRNPTARTNDCASCQGSRQVGRTLHPPPTPTLPFPCM